MPTVYPKKYAHGFCFAVLCCGYTLTDLPISIRLTSLALWQSNDCPSASKATLMNMDKYFMWIHYERLHNHNKAKHNKTVCIFLGIYCIFREMRRSQTHSIGFTMRKISWVSYLEHQMAKNHIFRLPTLPSSTHECVWLNDSDDRDTWLCGRNISRNNWRRKMIDMSIPSWFFKFRYSLPFQSMLYIE